MTYVKICGLRTPGDVDAATGSAIVLAADRARAIAAEFARARAVPQDRMTIVTGSSKSRSVVVTIGFAGQLPGDRP